MKTLLKIAAVLLLLAAAGICAVFCVNGYVVGSTKAQILSSEELEKGYDCVLVLGAGVWETGPSPMLADRLDYGIAVYKSGAADKMLMSGDHGRAEYDEVNTMKNYAVERGVPSEDVFMDHAGFSTYESLYRAKEIFCAEKIVIVTQRYHLHRALYIANRLGLEAVGIASDPRAYAGQPYYTMREIAARCKDVLQCIFLPEPTYLGETIPVWGDGNLTND